MYLLFAHQKNCHYFVHSSQAASIHLTIINSLSLQKLLKKDSVLAVLARCNFDTIRFQCLPNGSMPKNIIWRSRLFDKSRI